MEIWDNFQTAFHRCLDFNGRSRRNEFWNFALIAALFGAAASMWDGLLFGNESLQHLWRVVFFLPALAVSVRRLHDTGRSGYWSLLWLTGIGIIYLAILWAQDGEAEENEWGASPKYGFPEWEKEMVYAEEELIV